jgi:hypothetical protein
MPSRHAPRPAHSLEKTLSVYSKIFVFAVFSLLAISFWAMTGVLYWEFADDWRQPAFEGSLWFDLMTHHSHMFVFFPLFGTIALIAFFLPACVFVDMYFHRARREKNDIPFARFRFIFGFVVISILSAAIAWAFNAGDEAGIWQLRAELVRERPTAGTACAVPGPNGTCRRVTFPGALENVRKVSQHRERLGDLKRDCQPDPLIEADDTSRPRRFCFVTAKYSPDPRALAPHLLDDTACCRAMQRFETEVRTLYQADPGNRSLLDRLQPVTLGLKVFFLLVVLAISILLAARRARILSDYPAFAHRIDRGVIIGTVAMLFLPFMNHAYLLSSELLYGPNQPMVDAAGVSFYRVPYLLSGAFGVWAFIVMLYFVRREDKEAERTSKIIGTILSGVFVMSYDQIVDYAVRFMGPGAGNQAMMALVVLAAGMWLTLVWLKLAHGRPTQMPGHPAPAAQDEDRD